MEYITISAFAEKVGVTAQAIYKRVGKDLAPYIKEENGVKLISLEALELYSSKQPVTKPTSREVELEAELVKLREENAVKQQTINELYEKLNSCNEKWLEILDRQTTQHQLLLANQQTLQQQLLNSSPTQKEVDNQPTNPQEVDKPSNKPSLLARLFGKH